MSLFPSPACSTGFVWRHLRRKTRPGRLPVDRPSFITVAPFTITSFMPRAGRVGALKVARSIISAALKRTTSANVPGFSTPRSVSLSRDATALCQQTIGHHIQRHARAEFGAAINPHLFRDCAATWIAIYGPQHVQIIAAILGHSTLETSERYYNQAQGLEAGRRYHGTIKAIRGRARAASIASTRAL
jgi:integrase